MQANLKSRLFLVVFGLMVLAFCLAGSSANSEPQTVYCEVHTGPCSAIFSGTKVSLDISPKPVKAMQDLTFSVTFAGDTAVVDPYIDLVMVGMNMGRNRGHSPRPQRPPDLEGQGNIS